MKKVADEGSEFGDESSSALTTSTLQGEHDLGREDELTPQRATADPAAALSGHPVWYRALRVGLALLPLIIVHLSLVSLFFVPPTWIELVLFVVMSQLTGIGVTVGFHRYLAHHAFKTSRWLQFVLATAGCTALQKGPLWWVIYHRQHHMHSDTEGDVHSPVVDGFWYAHMGWLFARDLMRPDLSSIRDLTKFPELVWLDHLWILPGFAAAGACYLIDGWSGLFWGYCLSTAVIFQITFAINSFGHVWGRQRFATGEQSRNNWVLGILAMGEGWHNNHHRAPTSARHGFAWYEVDAAYQVIRLLRKLRLVWDVRQPPAAALAAAGRTVSPA
ncbi:acyl-CoA desaturase [Fimbriiglobus ruber]|uniref:Fatty acid desaturase n=1 Tax=Fimbriiglobus ruber TaxID=1908690 RepID=A0A225D0R9_9BACT|nr:acyl-CoA desaturase [Fimbriiglobus ruber]OWK35200.1 Fatty acid desaturase [Fimbriiglobus ruber]